MSHVELKEGHFTISVPDGRYFRFEDSEIYERVAGQGLSEVDVGWMQSEDDRLWLMEFKDYGLRSEGELREAVEDLENELPQNFIHAVLLISAVWAGIPFGRKLREDIEETFPTFPTVSCPVAGIVVVKTASEADKPLLGRLRTSLRDTLDVMEFETVLVLSLSDVPEEELGIQIAEREA